MQIKIKVWQVEELEESRNNLFLENQQLREKVSSLESTVQNHENSNASSCSRDAPEKGLLLLPYMVKIYTTYSFLGKIVFLTFYFWKKERIIDGMMVIYDSG